MSETKPLYLTFQYAEELVTIWRKCAGSDFYPTVVEEPWFEDCGAPDLDHPGILTLDIPAADFEHAKRYFDEYLIDIDAHHAKREEERQRWLEWRKKENERLAALERFEGCGDPTYRAGGSR